jgi:hypothetical protein
MRYALLLALPFLMPQDRGKKIDLPTTVDSAHYTLKTNATKEQAQELLDFMELVFTTYKALLKPDDPKSAEEKRSTVLLYKDNADYLASGAPPGSGAYYSLESKNLVGWYDGMFMKPFFAHEGMHQFTDLTSKNFRDFGMWFSEGIADCIGNCEVREKKLYMCMKSGTIARMRLPIVQGAIKQSKHFPLSRLFKLSQRDFMSEANVDLAYAQSWSFCHFLITYPDKEDRAHQIPNGKFRKNLAIYYELVRAGGTNHDKAWAEAFKGIPLDQLEELWKKYVLDMDAGKFLGFMGKEIPAEEADSLKLAPDKSGIKIEKLVDDGVAKKSGLQEGDVMTSFDGRLFPRKDAMNRLRVWMQEVPYGRAVKIKALRAGAEVEVTAKWEEKKK